MKTIVYLDQNYVSYLTKARLGVKVNLAAYYENLYDALREAVEANAIVCPVSTFHIEESSRDSRLAPELCRILAELSYETELRFWGDMLEAQAEAALHRYLGVQPPTTDPGWKEAFTKDPHCEFHGSPDAPSTSWVEGFVPIHRLAKIVHEREGVPPPIGDLPAQKRAEASGIVHNFYLQPWENIVRGRTDILSTAGLDALPRLWRVYSKVTGHSMGWPLPKALTEFLASHEIASVPFVDIASALYAAIVLDRQRKPKGSDLSDVPIAATVLPYCDVFATDGHMKQLILAQKLDKRYKVTVFGSRKADVLALTSLVRGL